MAKATKRAPSKKSSGLAKVDGKTLDLENMADDLLATLKTTKGPEAVSSLVETIVAGTAKKSEREKALSDLITRAATGDKASTEALKALKAQDAINLSAEGKLGFGPAPKEMPKVAETPKAPVVEGPAKGKKTDKPLPEATSAKAQQQAEANRLAEEQAKAEAVAKAESDARIAAERAAAPKFAPPVEKPVEAVDPGIREKAPPLVTPEQQAVIGHERANAIREYANKNGVDIDKILEKTNVKQLDQVPDTAAAKDWLTKQIKAEAETPAAKAAVRMRETAAALPRGKPETESARRGRTARTPFQDAETGVNIANPLSIEEVSKRNFARMDNRVKIKAAEDFLQGKAVLTKVEKQKLGELILLRNELRRVPELQTGQAKSILAQTLEEKFKALEDQLSGAGKPNHRALVEAHGQFFTSGKAKPGLFDYKREKGIARQLYTEAELAERGPTLGQKYAQDAKTFDKMKRKTVRILKEVAPIKTNKDLKDLLVENGLIHPDTPYKNQRDLIEAIPEKYVGNLKEYVSNRRKEIAAEKEGAKKATTAGSEPAASTSADFETVTADQGIRNSLEKQTAIAEKNAAKAAETGTAKAVKAAEVAATAAAVAPTSGGALAKIAPKERPAGPWSSYGKQAGPYPATAEVAAAAEAAAAKTAAEKGLVATLKRGGGQAMKFLGPLFAIMGVYETMKMLREGSIGHADEERLKTMEALGSVGGGMQQDMQMREMLRNMQRTTDLAAVQRQQGLDDMRAQYTGNQSMDALVRGHRDALAALAQPSRPSIAEMMARM